MLLNLSPQLITALGLAAVALAVGSLGCAGQCGPRGLPCCKNSNTTADILAGRCAYDDPEKKETRSRAELSEAAALEEAEQRRSEERANKAAEAERLSRQEARQRDIEREERRKKEKEDAAVAAEKNREAEERATEASTWPGVERSLARCAKPRSLTDCDAAREYVRRFGSQQWASAHSGQAARAIEGSEAAMANLAAASAAAEEREMAAKAAAAKRECLQDCAGSRRECNSACSGLTEGARACIGQCKSAHIECELRCRN